MRLRPGGERVKREMSKWEEMKLINQGHMPHTETMNPEHCFGNLEEMVVGSLLTIIRDLPKTP